MNRIKSEVELSSEKSEPKFRLSSEQNIYFKNFDKLTFSASNS